jgi:hypothetical protein
MAHLVSCASPSLGIIHRSRTEEGALADLFFVDGDPILYEVFTTKGEKHNHDYPYLAWLDIAVQCRHL